MRRTDAIEMGDADQHSEAGVQLFLQSGAWQAWLLATSGFQPLLDRLVHLGDVPMSPIVQGCLSLCTELLKPAVGGRSTDLDRCLPGRFLPGASCLHEINHLPFCFPSLLVVHARLLAHR